MRRVVGYGGLVLLALLLQAGVFPSLRLFGATPELVLATAWLLGLHSGSERGAAIGFAGGLLQDLYVGSPRLGIAALVFTLAGLTAGRIRDVVVHPYGVLLPLSTLLASIAAGVVYRVVAYLFGSGFSWGNILAASSYTALLSIPWNLVVRRVGNFVEGQPI
jgi:rod shape-determining protein MreD